MKTDLETVEFALRQNGVDAVTIKKVLDDLKSEAKVAQEETKEKSEKEQKVKYIIARTDANTSDVTEIPMCVVECPDSVAHHAIIDNIINAGRTAQATAKKFKKYPLKSVFDILERCPPKFMKEQKVRVITKELPMVITTDNKI